MTPHDRPMDPLDLSVAIMCRDNEDTIGRTLASVAPLAREIVAIDSGSTDRTPDILASYGARVESMAWQGHIATCQLAIDRCTCRWVLAIDSDESVEPDLAQSIREALEHPPDDIAGFRVNRKVWYRGRFLEHTFQPEWRLRIVRQDLIGPVIRSMGVEPHHRLDFVEPHPELRVVDLRGTLRHDTIVDLASFLQRQVRLGALCARDLAESGTRTTPLRLMTSPTGAFLKQIVLKQGWRDGWRGWVAAGSAALGTLAKHACLLDYSHASGRTEDRDRI